MEQSTLIYDEKTYISIKFYLDTWQIRTKIGFLINQVVVFIEWARIESQNEWKLNKYKNSQYVTISKKSELFLK